MISLLLVALLSAPTESLPRSGGATVGAPAPWFSGWTLEDRVQNRDRLLKGARSGLVVVLFATWCKPCVEGLERLKAGRARLREAGLDTVLVAYREEAATVAAWLGGRGMAKGAVLVDRFGVATRALGGARATKEGEIAQLPRTLVLSKDGTVRAVFGREGPDYLERILEAAR